MDKLVTISYNLNVEVENALKDIKVIVINGDETFTLAKKERANLNKTITAFETSRKALNKAINDEFKTSLQPMVDLLAKFDTNIEEFDTQRKAERLDEIKAHFDSVTKLNWDLAPQDEFLKAYPSYKSPIELWTSKVEHEKTAIAGMGAEAIKVYEETYDLTKAIAYAPKPTVAETYSTFTITVADSIKNEVVAYLESKGVIVG